MNTYRTYLTVTNPGQLTLTDLPFQSGQTVEILIRLQKMKPGKSLNSLLKLFKETQKLPQIQTITNVLKRPKFKLPLKLIDKWENMFHSLIEVIESNEHIDFPRDQQDAKFLECALASEVE